MGPIDHKLRRRSLLKALEQVDALVGSLADPCILVGDQTERERLAACALKSSKALYDAQDKAKLIVDRGFTDEQVWRQLEHSAIHVDDLKKKLKETQAHIQGEGFQFFKSEEESEKEKQAIVPEPKEKKENRKEKKRKLKTDKAAAKAATEVDVEEPHGKRKKKNKALENEDLDELKELDMLEKIKPEKAASKKKRGKEKNKNTATSQPGDAEKDFFNIDELAKFLDENEEPDDASDDDMYAEHDDDDGEPLMFDDFFDDNDGKADEPTEPTGKSEQGFDEDEDEEEGIDNALAAAKKQKRSRQGQVFAMDDQDDDEDLLDDALARSALAEDWEKKGADEILDEEDDDEDEDEEGLVDDRAFEDLDDEEKELELSLQRFQKAYMQDEENDDELENDLAEGDNDSNEDEEEEEESAKAGDVKGVTDEQLAAEEKAIQERLKKLQAPINMKDEEDDEDSERGEKEEEDEKDEDEDSEEDSDGAKKHEEERDDEARAAKASTLAKLRSKDKRLLAMEEDIRKMEEEQIADKHWTEKGEAKATDRPLNSLLETHLDLPMSCFASKRSIDQAIALGHTIEEDPFDKTETVSFDLEGIIRQRVADQTFDNVLRIAKVKPTLEKDLDADEMLDFNKSRVGLADIYAQQYEKEIFGEATAAEEKVSREKEILKRVFAKTMYKLDQLTNSHFTPRPPMIVKGARLGVAAVKVEEAIPMLVADSGQKAPEELVAPLKQTVVKEDMGPEDRQALRRTKKEQRRKRELAKLHEGEMSKEEWKKRREDLDKKNKRAKELKAAKGKPKEAKAKKLKASKLLAQAGASNLDDISHREAMREFRKKENNFKPAKSFKL